MNIVRVKLPDRVSYVITKNMILINRNMSKAEIKADIESALSPGRRGQNEDDIEHRLLLLSAMEGGVPVPVMAKQGSVNNDEDGRFA